MSVEGTAGERRRWPRAAVGLVAVPVLAVAVVGCSSSTEEQAATQTALLFAATAATDPQAACAALAPVTPPLDLDGYLASPDFWNRTLQNWQSELLAVGSLVVFAVFLRERGSPESKPVGMPHADTASDT